MDSTENLIGEILFAWLHTICTPLLFLGPFHPGTPGHPLNPMQWLQVDVPSGLTHEAYLSLRSASNLL
jgi:hypothetical protein